VTDDAIDAASTDRVPDDTAAGESGRADVLVVVPTYNEAESIEAMLGRLRQAVPDADVLVVDDGSPDGTGDIADRMAAHDRRIRVLHRTAKDGLGRAYLAGFAVAIRDEYARVVEIDADGSHDPAALPAMLHRSRTTSADLVLGSRWVPGGRIVNWPWYRQAISRGGSLYARTVLRSGIRDLTSGFRVFRVESLQLLDLESVASHGYGFQVEMAWRLERAGAVIVEHPITFVERASGRSKMHAGIVVEALARVTRWGLLGR
jgi:dolichol-phosphate mannosyltransferase